MTVETATVRQPKDASVGGPTRGNAAKPKGATLATRSWWLPVAGLATLLVLWVLVSVLADPLRAPSPWAVFTQLVTGWDHVRSVSHIGFTDIGYASAIVETATTTWFAATLGVIIGFVVGVLMGEFKSFAISTRPILILALTMPILVALPFLQMWFGASRVVGVGLVALFAAVTTTVIIRAAVEGVPMDLRHYAMAMGASRGHRIRKVTLRTIMPDTLAAARVAMAGGWGFMCIAEVMSASPGMGRLIDLLGQISNMAGMLAGVFVLVAIALVTDGVLFLIGRAVNAWQE